MRFYATVVRVTSRACGGRFRRRRLKLLVDSELLPKIMALVSAGIEYFAAKGHIQLILGPMFSGKT